MIGIPINANVLDIGRGAGANWDIISAPTLIAEPVRIDMGSIMEWADVLQIALAMCGATIPTNPRGPQKAVAAPVIRQQLKTALSLILPTSAPDICAYSSPNRIMSSPFLPLKLIVNPMMTAIIIIAIWVHVVWEKLPADQL